MTDSGERDSAEWRLVSILVGVLAAALVIIALSASLGRIYPVRGSGSQSAASDGLLLGAYALASFIGGIAASITAGRMKAWPALVTGAILMIPGIYGVLAVSQPLWFRAASFLTYPMALVGHLLIRKRAAD